MKQSLEDKNIFKGEFINYKYMKRGSIGIQNRKGLSAIIATLLIILLTLVAVGIIWVAVGNIVPDSSIDSKVEKVSIWEQINDGDIYSIEVFRTPVPDGWLVMTKYYSDGIATTYIPDINHKWEVKNE